VRTRQEQIVAESTGCTRLEYIKNILKDTWNDVDAAVEIILAEQRAGIDSAEPDASAKGEEATATQQEADPVPDEPEEKKVERRVTNKQRKLRAKQAKLAKQRAKMAKTQSKHRGRGKSSGKSSTSTDACLDGGDSLAGDFGSITL
jgi:hypothetical protein